MATTTTNYGLKKPAGADFFNVADANGNMDLIDSQMKTNADAAAAALAKAEDHTQAAGTITAGTLGGQVKANADAAATLGTAQVRNIYAGTADMTAGTTALASGDIYVMYE